MVSKNVGAHDRLLRAFSGGGLAIAELSGYLDGIEQYFHYFAIGMAIWLIVTGTSGNCPTYTLFGVSTCSPKIEENENTNTESVKICAE